MLEAASAAGAIMSRLQRHYGEAVAPRLAAAGTVSDLGACGGGLLALLRAAEEGVLLVLRKCSDAFIIQVGGEGGGCRAEGKGMAEGQIHASAF